MTALVIAVIVLGGLAAAAFFAWDERNHREL